jgi:hypothetical protein
MCDKKISEISTFLFTLNAYEAISIYRIQSTVCYVTTGVCNARICSYMVDKRGNKIAKTQNRVNSYAIFNTYITQHFILRMMGVLPSISSP